MADRTDGIFDHLHIANIYDGYTERYDGIKTYYYELLYNIDNDWINDDMVQNFIDLNSAKFAEISKNYVFNLLVFGFKDSQSFKNVLTRKDEPDIINEYLGVKRNFIKRYKTVRVFLTCTLMGEDKDSQPVIGALKVKPLNSLEIYNVLFNILNPGLYRDDVTLKPYNYQEVMDETISLPMCLTKTPIREYDDNIIFDDLICKQFYMPTPPSLITGEFALSSAINDLCQFDSDFFISVIFKNVEYPGKLATKKYMANSYILNKFSTINAKTADELNEYNELLQKNNLSSVEMSFQIALFNENQENLSKDCKSVKTLNGFEGCVLVPSSFTRYKDYMDMIPSVCQSFKYHFHVSSEQMATILMFPKYDFNSLAIFEKKGRLLTSLDVSDFRTTNKPGLMIFAPPGSGKSALLNYLLFNLLIQHKKSESLLIDFGGSYMALFGLLNRSDMTYTEMKTGRTEDGGDIHYNPFDLEFGKEVTKEQIENKIFVLKSFLTVALELADSKYESLIEKTAEEMYNAMMFGKLKKRISERHRKEGDPVFFLDVYENSGRTDFKAFANAMPTFTDFFTTMQENENIKRDIGADTIISFSQLLRGFTEVLSNKVFNGVSTSNLLRPHLIADLKEIALRDEKLLNLILTYLIGSKLLNFMNNPDKSQPKFIVIDEYNQFKTRSAYIDKIADTIFKVGRKENVHLFLITQNITDFNPSFFNVCGRLLSFKPASADQLNVLGEIIDEKVENLRPLITNIGTVQGEYSEFLVFNSDDARSKNFYRLRLSKFEYYAFITTSPEDRTRRNEILKQNGNDFKAAVYQMVAENEKKRAR